MVVNGVNGTPLFLLASSYASLPTKPARPDIAKFPKPPPFIGLPCASTC